MFKFKYFLEEKKMVNSKENSRIVWLDALKGIGILLVIVSHSNCQLPFVNFFIAGYIQLFFIAAGFTYRSSLNSISFCRKKAIRLLLPYFTYGLLTLLFFTLMGGQNFLKGICGLLYGCYSLEAYPNCDFKILPIGTQPLWFLPAMFSAYMVLCIKERIAKEKRLFFFILILMIQLGLSSQTYLLPWSLDIAIYFALCILFGALFKEYFFLEKRKGIFFVVLLIYGLLICINKNINLSIREYGSFRYISLILSYIIGVFYTFILSYICRQFEKNIFIGVLAKIGNSSMRLMCIHYPIMIFVSDFLWHLNITGINQFLLLMIQMSVIGLITILIQLAVDRFSSHFSLLKYI